MGWKSSQFDRVGEFTLVVIAAFVLLNQSSRAQPNRPFSDPPPALWKDTVGGGFTKGATELDIAAGAGIGLPILLSRGHHHWAIGVLDYGWMVSGVVGKDHWFRGNWEIMADVFGGEQFHPEGAYFVGLSPHLRYNFATGCRWVPFIDVGAGATATDIREPDLSTTFEFNLQGGAGTHFFLRDDLALTLQWRFIHFSNAGLKFPNLGVNNSTFLLGISWFF